VSLLGQVRVEDAAGSALVAVPPSTARLLTALALVPGLALSSEGLFSEVWPLDADRPRNPRATLQTLVSRLRARCAPGLVVSTGDGYRLAPGLGAVDLLLAETLVERARSALRGEDAAGAERVARAGLGLWRGEPGGGLPDDPLRDEVVRRASRAAHGLRQLRAEALLPLGRSDEAAELAAELAVDSPHDDALCLLAMRALAASGRPGRAVDAFDALRDRLRRDLGTGPAPEVVAFHAALLREEVAPAPRCRIRSGLRAAPNRLVGREVDVDQVAGLAARSRLVTVVGEGGVGKTRVAREVVDRVTDGYSAVFAVDLAGVRRATELLLAVATALGVPGGPAGSDPALERYVVDVVSAQRTLLVLDSCEHLLPTVAGWVSRLLGAAPGVRVLATSRAPLRIAAERVHPLGPLAPDDARALFAERARAVRPDVRLDDAVVARLCRRLDGSPLAIELAAGRARSMAVEEVEERLADRYALLAGGDRGGAPRHASADAVVRWSWDLLTDRQRRLARLVSVHPGGFSAAAVLAVTDPDAARSEIDVLTDLEALVDQSLVQVQDDPGTGSARYRMAAMVREFAAGRRDRHGESAEAHRGAARWAVDLARTAVQDLLGADQEGALHRLAVERIGLLGVLEHALRSRDPGTVVAVHAALGLSWLARGEYAELSAVTTAVHTCTRGHRPRDQLVDVHVWSRLLVAAPLLLFAGPESAAPARAELRRALDDPRGAPPLARLLGSLLECDDPGAVEDLLASAVDGSDEAGARVALWLLAEAADGAGRTVRARALAERAHARATTADDTWTRARVAELLARLHGADGRPDDAGRWWQEAIGGLRAIGADVRLPTARLALCRLQSGDPAGAAAELAPLGGPDEPPSELRLVRDVGLAECALARGAEDEGLRRYREAVQAMGDGSVRTVLWELLAGAGCVAAHVQAARGAEATEVVRVLRRRTVQVHRDHPAHTDVRLLGTVVRALASWAAQRAPVPGSAGVAGGAPDLWAVAVTLGVRRDLPALAELAAAATDDQGAAAAPPGPLRLDVVLAALEDLDVEQVRQR
jgi:predicted ATPase/DNA-binding SARP family transcriptional activator